MVNRTAAALVLRDGDKARLEQWVRSTSMPAGYPTGELHLVMDNYATQRVEVRAWLDAKPIHVHFTPTSGSWLNLVEVWFSITENQALHRGTSRSVGELNAKISEFINGWNPPAHLDQTGRRDHRQDPPQT
jgi:hypothetical protein